MKRCVLTLLLSTFLAVPAAFAQDQINHGEIGVFADYLRLVEPSSHTWGLGARASVNLNSYTQLEGEMSYDFSRGFVEGFTDSTTGAVSFADSDYRVLHGVFGPKFQTGGGPIRAYVTVKGGFINFRFDDAPATFGTFFSSVDSLRDGSTFGVFYPAGGLEFYVWIVGMRLEVGDLMYFDGGTKQNLRVTLGPHFRF